MGERPTEGGGLLQWGHSLILQPSSVSRVMKKGVFFYREKSTMLKRTVCVEIE